MKSYKLFSVLLTVGIFIGLSSCMKDFEKINTSPTGMEDKDVPIAPRFLVPQHAVVFNVNNTNFEYQLVQNLNGDMFSGYMMAPTPYGGNKNNLNYFMMIGWNGATFEKGTANFIKPIAIILKESWRVNYSEYAQIAKIIKVAGMHQVTDVYGPIPYSEANKGGTSVPYDSQEEVYKSFFNELGEAIDSLNIFIKTDPAMGLSPSRISEFDRTCGGDVKLWLKFANTLRLRLAIRLAAVAPELAKEQAEAAASDPGGFVQMGDKRIQVTDNTFVNPLYVMSDEYTDCRMGAPAESMLKGYNDPRLEVYYRPVVNKDMKDKNGNKVTIEGQYFGIRNGIDIVDKNDYVDNSSSIRLSKFSSESPVVWMTIAESYFLRAEGALRGWNMGGGSAESFYKDGVIASFSENGLSTGQANTYLDGTSTAAPYVDNFNSDNNVPAGSKLLNDVPVKWDNADTKERQLQRIITQKWLAMFPMGHEAWTEFRRTGYPKLFTVMINNSDGTISTEGFIRRLPFPDSEIRTNKQELDKAITNYLNGPDTGGTRLWWDVDAIVTGDNKL